MSIRPIDYTNLVSKSQEISKVRQIENNRLDTQVDQAVLSQEKQINRSFLKVRDTNKSEGLIIDVNKENKRGREENKKDRKDKDKEKPMKKKRNLGSKIDIRI